MAEAQVKVALSALAAFSVFLTLTDDAGRDDGDAQEIKPGKSATVSVAEGCAATVTVGGKVESPPKDKEFGPAQVTITGEKDSTHAAVAELRGAGGQMDVNAVGEKGVVYTLLDANQSIWLTRGKKAA